MTACQRTMSFSCGAPLMPAGGSVCSRLKSCISRLRAGIQHGRVRVRLLWGRPRSLPQFLSLAMWVLEVKRFGVRGGRVGGEDGLSPWARTVWRLSPWARVTATRSSPPGSPTIRVHRTGATCLWGRTQTIASWNEESKYFRHDSKSTYIRIYKTKELFGKHDITRCHRPYLVKRPIYCKIFLFLLPIFLLSCILSNLCWHIFIEHHGNTNTNFRFKKVQNSTIL
jgi:hypothetical protein